MTTFENKFSIFNDYIIKYIADIITGKNAVMVNFLNQ